LGLACGVIVMGLAIAYLAARELARPNITAAAATAAPKPPFGFCPPS
jgi:hypothetical protein